MQKKSKPKKKPRPLRRNISEALTAFTAWLTTRDRPLIFSAKHECGPIAEIVGAFLAENRMRKPRDNYRPFKNPKNKDHLTNVSQGESCVAPPPPTQEQALKSIMRTLLELCAVKQDAVIAGMISQIKSIRTQRLDTAKKMQLGTEIDARVAQDQLYKLESIMRGDVSTIYMRSNNIESK